jgi:hypothetical protein
MPTKRTAKTPAPPAKPITAQEAENAGRAAHSEAVSEPPAPKRRQAALPRLSTRESAREIEEIEIEQEEVKNVLDRFLSTANRSEMRKLFSILQNHVCILSINSTGTLADAILLAMPSEVVANPNLEGFNAAHVLQRAATLCDRRRGYLLKCLDALDLDSGCMTPAEDFIDKILFLYESQALTPTQIKSTVAEFEENYADMEEGVALFIENNPATFKKLDECRRGPSA